MDCYFFGTFNPIHFGHISIAKQVREALGFERIIFVPSYMPPHKLGATLPFEDRLNMTKLAVGETCVSDIERKMPIPSYTYKTIEKLYKENNNEKVNFILGFDQFFKLESWKEPEILKQKTNFIVIPRRFSNGQILSEKAFEYFRNKGFSFQVLNIDFLDVSSEKIRQLCSQNKDISNLTTKEVQNYIEEHKLYRKLAERKSIF